MKFKYVGTTATGLVGKIYPADWAEQNVVPRIVVVGSAGQSHP